MSFSFLVSKDNTRSRYIAVERNGKYERSSTFGLRDKSKISPVAIARDISLLPHVSPRILMLVFCDISLDDGSLDENKNERTRAGRVGRLEAWILQIYPRRLVNGLSNKMRNRIPCAIDVESNRDVLFYCLLVN